MVALANERVAYFNGKIVPESDVLIPFRDRGFMAGDAVFDTARTVKHRIFKLRSISTGSTTRCATSRSIRGSREGDDRHHGRVVARNPHLIDADDDYWVSQRISRGPTRRTPSPAAGRRRRSSWSAGRCR
jgi:branched-chain amino acid aminotransferase